MRRGEDAGSKGVWHTSEKKKEGNDVCGETRTPDRKEFGTRQKRKGRKRRVRRGEDAGMRGVRHTSEKKKARSSQEKQEKGRNI